MDIYDDMNFYLSPDKFVVEPNGQEKCDFLVIDRITQSISVHAAKPEELAQVSPHRRICGILGAIKLLAGHYLIVATHRIFVGVINGQAIWRLAGFDIFPYIPSSSHLSEVQKVQNDSYLEMLRRTLNTPHFYFSYSYDITHTLQRLNGMPPEFLQMGLLERADTRFVWNGFLLKDFQRFDCRKFNLPIILGFVSINQVNVNGNSFTWTLITRRSVHRAGTRLFCRGIDQNGNCANYVETEQIVEYLGDKVSFVQTRGSIPIYWRQTPNLRYKPPPEIIPGKDHMAAFAKHIDSQLLHYGRQVIINLIDHRGPEDTLEKAYANVVGLLSNSAVRYEAFDFHAECRKMRWDRLNILIDRLAHEQDEFSVFHLRRDGTLLSSQDGVFRTNCIDCLDRTNVVQSMLAKRSLTQTLMRLGILLKGQTIENCYAFEMLFKNVWADNADLVSTQYSGTGALKTDFTRTGKRTKMGLIKDGINSLTRYYKNNFNDGFRQDGIDLLLGNYVIQDGEGISVPCPLNTHRGWKYLTFPSVLMFAVAMFFASSVFPHEYNTENLLFLLFWGAMVGVSTAGIFRYGMEFVDWPKLLPPIKVEA
ncbi:phosphatidylinositol-3-phosphatase SAC1 [Phlebotomus papatasi]|uniref:phosphatidylinositol-3-phosphatase SAC1 n=1 Tax=Phlebotomus papatasi TaxID=29031 RepID=UPI0024842F78|nr:phosphatidylinositol-3-phosphatase SAC1 [Phlebotomus papatasi]